MVYSKHSHSRILDKMGIYIYFDKQKPFIDGAKTYKVHAIHQQRKGKCIEHHSKISRSQLSWHEKPTQSFAESQVGEKPTIKANKTTITM